LERELAPRVETEARLEGCELTMGISDHLPTESGRHQVLAGNARRLLRLMGPA